MHQTPRFMLRLPLAAFAAVLLFAATAWGAPPGNDDVAGVVPLGLNMPAEGSLAEAGDDYRVTEPGCFVGGGQTSSEAAGADVIYRFVAPLPGQYTFRTLESAGNAVLATTLKEPPVLEGPQSIECLLASNRTGGGANPPSEEVGPLTLFAGQVMYVIVDQTAVTAAGFEVVAERSPALEPFSSNDTPATATAAGCGTRGRISPAGDVDFYSLGPATGTAYAMAETFGSEISDADLRVTTAVDTLEFDDLNADGRFGPFAPVIAGTPLTGVSSFLRVSGSSETEPYRLYSTVQPAFASATPEVEPNDTTPLADTSPINYFSGTTAPGDPDLFSFFLPARTTAFIALDADPLRDNTPQNAALALGEVNGGTVKMLQTVNDSGVVSNTTSGAGSLTSTTPFSPAEGITWRARRSTTHLVEVTGTGGDYALSVAVNCKPGPPPAIAVGPGSLPDGEAGAAYQQTLTASGGSGEYAFDIQSGALPAGLSLGPQGQLSGTPTQAGTFQFSAIAIDGQNFTGEQTYTIEVAPAPIPPAPPPQQPAAPITTFPAAPSTPPARCAGRAATISGTAKADRLKGTGRADVIQALGGNDTVSGLGGKDVVCGGGGRDTLKGNGGADTLRGDAGNDAHKGGGGKDRLQGGGGRDTCDGAAGKDTGSSCESGRL
jgi:hypothetical protein